MIVAHWFPTKWQMKPDSFRGSSTQWEWQIRRKRLSNNLTALAVLTDRHFFLLLLMPPFKGEYSRMETWTYPVSHKGREDCPRVPGCHLFLISWDFDPNNGFTWAVRKLSTNIASCPQKGSRSFKGWHGLPHYQTKGQQDIQVYWVLCTNYTICSELWPFEKHC